MNALTKLRKAADEAGWSEATALVVACNYIDAHQDPIVSFDVHLEAQIEDEKQFAIDNDGALEPDMETEPPAKQKPVSVLILAPNAAPEVRTIVPTIANLQQMVGGFVEMIAFLQGSHAYLDEDSKVRDDKPPVRNLFATQLCRTFQKPGGVPIIFRDDWIAGTMIVLGSDMVGGFEQSVPTRVIAAVFNYWEETQRCQPSTTTASPT